MKSLALKAMMAAAVVAAMAGVASAQNLKADIPFAFIASGSVMPPGEYKIFRDMAGTSGTIRLLNVDSDRVLAILPASPRQTSALDPSNLVFRCDGGSCALVRIATPYWAVDFAAPKHFKGADTRLAAIRLGQ